MKLVSDANKNKYTFKLLHHPSAIIYPIEIALAHLRMRTQRFKGRVQKNVCKNYCIEIQMMHPNLF